MTKPLSLNEKIRRARKRLREKQKIATAARAALGRAEDAEERAFHVLDALEAEKDRRKQEKEDRAKRTLVTFDGVEYVVSVEMHPFGWRFWFRVLGDSWRTVYLMDTLTPEFKFGGSRNIPWEWTDENKQALLETLRKPVGDNTGYFLWAHACMTGTA